jgi:diketogulonate reductase-like aldo/keto reductase
MLKRLGTDYLDLLIIHWPGVSKEDVKSPKNSQVRRETWKALVELQQEGKVKDIGVSNFLKHHLEDLLKHSEVKPAVNQFEIHPLLWETDTIDYCRQQEIAIEAYSPLARADPRLLNHPIIKDISQRLKRTPAQICLRWALQHDFIILPKSKSKERIEENFKVTDFTLNEAEMLSINELAKANVHVCWDPNQVTV